MRVAIFGTGYVGLTSGADFATRGHDVVCVDISEERITGLQNGSMPFFEAGLPELVAQGVQAGKLQFTLDGAAAVRDADIVMVAVGTPLGADGTADLRAVWDVAGVYGAHVAQPSVFVIKSTVPVGTSERAFAIIREAMTDKTLEVAVASNPEFLSQGTAVRDTQSPTRIVVGADSGMAREKLRTLYASFISAGVPYVEMSPRSSEAVKCAANAFLATKISFINEIANFAQAVGANVDDIAVAIGLDPRIGPHFLKAGLGYGGGCLSKDLRALIAAGHAAGYDFALLPQVEAVNEAQKTLLYDKLSAMLGGVQGKTIAIWGLSFKPGTDDIRHAPALTVVSRLLAEGATVVAHDPQAMANMRRQFPQVTYAADHLAALDGADALVVMTEWSVFCGTSLPDVAKRLKGNVVLDGRNIWKTHDSGSLRYWSIGNPEHAQHGP